MLGALKAPPERLDVTETAMVYLCEVAFTLMIFNGDDLRVDRPEDARRPFAVAKSHC